MLKPLRELAGGQRLLWLVCFVALCRWLIGSNLVFVYLVSYAYHFFNLAAFLTRRVRFEQFFWLSLLGRIAALGLLAVLIWPYRHSELSWFGLLPLVAGVLLHAAAVWALGIRRTYYAVELGALPPLTVRRFPYNVVQHPMEVGSMLQFIGLYFVFPTFTRDYPYLILGHLALSAITMLVEHFDLHVREHFFPALTGRFTDDDKRATIDSLRNWAVEHYRDYLHGECSLHQYVKHLPPEVVQQIDRLRWSNQIMEPLARTFPGSTIAPMWMTDEIYLSRYNFDGGGDQGLFDRHYDGNLRFMPAASVVRSLIYLSSDDHLEVVFCTSQVRAGMKTCDFGLLDFHKELHWVEGSYDPQNPPRILLKCNYYIDHSGIATYRQAGILLNVAMFYLVRAAMEYSKSPKTILQRGIGRACNFFRTLNNVSPAVPVVVVLAVLAISLKAALHAFAAWF